MRKAVDLAPHNRRFRETGECWVAHRQFLIHQRQHAFDYASVHRPLGGLERLQQVSNMGLQAKAVHPIVPEGSLGHNAGVYQKQVVGSSHLMFWGESGLIAAIHEESLPKPLPPIPPMDPLALPPGPIPPRLRIGVP